MNKYILILAGVLLSLVSGLKAADLSVANVTLTAAATVQLFATGTSAPLTYQASTVAGPGISVKRLVFAANTLTSSGQTTVQLWDTPDGRTYTAGAKPMTPVLNGLQPPQDKPYIWDFSLFDGSDRAGGAYCKGYPVLLETGSNTPNASLHYMKSTTNPVIPGTAAGVVPH